MPDRPNVLWIYCDELRADALGCYAEPGGLRPRTPNIDALANESVVYDRAYTNSPICVPSRTALLTGRLPEETGVYANEGSAPGYELPDVFSTFTEAFADAGYVTASYGKEHIPEQLSPWQVCDEQGAGRRDPFAGAIQEEMILSPERGFVIGGVTEVETLPAERITANVVKFLEEAQGPFILRASYLQPHTPVLPPARLRREFPPHEQPGIGRGAASLSRFEQVFAEINGAGGIQPEVLRRAQADYLALVAWVDEQVGILLATLEELELDRDTIVILTSDHGAHLGETGAFGKHTFAPNSQRVPLLLRWRGHLAAGRDASLAQSVDIGPTLAWLAGIDLPEDLSGRALTSPQPAPQHIFATIGHGGPQSRAFPNGGTGEWEAGRGWPRRTCIRSGRWRLDMNVRIDGGVPTAAEEDIFLADSEHDPGETRNLAGHPEHATICASLAALVREHAASAVNFPSDEEIQRLQKQAIARRRAGSSVERK
ncbi:sulfatase [Pseudoclavibacter sp. RFBB5]|uniref:sulfatase family protein n=1 Tax=Pseudoclavibacter sp. RFBB5 TaxID=2080574 RepID=UPI000CE93953|nr:sulfatase-like hydrolase/transferase [Pseudoclavibacter sp. RFBB5]PPG33496.1 hypothetical protein C5B97_02525 [Pseudoclavibacter sp. RFBB5]